MAHTHTHINKNILNRLARAQGQVRSIHTMVSDGRDCSEVLIQIAAARSALGQAGRLILEDHMQHCITDALEAGRGQEALDDLKTALKQFIR